MTSTTSLHIVWSVHARERELERVAGGITLPRPDQQPLIRLMYLGTYEGSESWLLQTKQAYLFGTIFSGPGYDVFLIRTVVARPTIVWQPPLAVQLYELKEIYEQGQESEDCEQWLGYRRVATAYECQGNPGARPEPERHRPLPLSA